MTDPLRTIAAILERSLHASQADRAALAAIARAGDAGQRARIDMRRFVECAMSTRQQSERDEPLAHAESIAAQIAAVEAIAVSDAPHTAGHFPVSDRAKAAVARLEEADAEHDRAALAELREKHSTMTMQWMRAKQDRARLIAALERVKQFTHGQSTVRFEINALLAELRGEPG